MCKKSWETRDDFLADNEVELAGYQVDFIDVNEGYYLFNHSTRGCGTSIAVLVGSMLDLYDGPVYEDSKFESADCEGHCLNVNDFDKCDLPCSNARAREIMGVILSRKNRRAAQV